MPEGKAKFIEDAARVIDGRVAALEEEISRRVEAGHLPASGSDRAAIAEARHCARLIRSLLLRPYRGDPYAVAHDHYIHGRAN